MTHPSPDARPSRSAACRRPTRSDFGSTVRSRLQGLDSKSPQIYGLFYPNGAGKSTTIKILMNLVRPSNVLKDVVWQPVDQQYKTRRLVGLPENPRTLRVISRAASS